MKKGLKSSRLAPTKDCTILHMHRANHQCHMWKCTQQPILNLPFPIGNGWIKPDGGKRDPELMKNPLAPENPVELTVCRYTKGRMNNTCKCRTANLTYIESCSCGELCTNQLEEDSGIEDTEE